MHIEVAEVFDIVVIRLTGSFTEDINLEKGIKKSGIGEAPRVLINFELVDYINSNCFRSLARMHHRLASKGGDLRLCSLRHNVRQIFSFAKLDTGFHIYRCEDEGLASFYNKFSASEYFTTAFAYSS